ncbi:MAG: ABC transporter permease [Bacteroidota bacterium]
MNKILLIIQREYLTKVKKKSFIVMTILGPILMASLFVLPAYLATRRDEKKVISVLDETGLFFPKFQNNDNYTFLPVAVNLQQVKDSLIKKGDYLLLYIPATQLNVPNNAVIYSDKQPTFTLKDYISGVMSRELEKLKLGAEIRKEILRNTPGYKPGNDTTAEDLMSETILKNIRTNVNIETFKTEQGGTEHKSNMAISMGIGLVASMLIYMFIFMFGAQVMRGVIEEKTSRIVEVIISSVKPFQLMMGKIIGVALVGLTQFLLWIAFTFIIITVAQSAFPHQDKKTPLVEQNTITGQSKVLSNEMKSETPGTVKPDEDGTSLDGIFDDFPYDILVKVLVAFFFYFLFGYLLYAALFAAIGSAVDNDADTQQFMLPVTVPLILSIVVAQTVIQNPGSPLAFWMSMIPLTSPVIMMVRISMDTAPLWQIALSIGLLILGFLGTTWLAAKIYRTGILMYGKKSNYRELWKWIRYKG